MFFDLLLSQALGSGRMVVREKKPGVFVLQVKIGGAYFTLSRIIVEVGEFPTEPEKV